MHEDLDDFHIITDEDLLVPPTLPPATIDLGSSFPLRHPPPPSLDKHAPKLQLQTTGGALARRSQNLESASANTPHSAFASDTSGPSEIGDLTRSFPPPPSHIPEIVSPLTREPAPSRAHIARLTHLFTARSPLAQAQYPAAPAPIPIEHTTSATPTTKESIFSISRFKTGVKRILRASARIPLFRKPSAAPPPAPPPIFINSEPLLPQHPADPPVAPANPRHSIGDTSVDDRLFRKFEFVDPNSLTYTPTPEPYRELVQSSSGSTFIPPSPSWLASQVTSELDASNHQPSGLSLEIDRPVQKVPTLSLCAPTVPSRVPGAQTTTSPPLSPLDVTHEAKGDEHEAISKLRIPAIPIASRTSSANSKLSFATANSDFSVHEPSYLHPTAY